jgi:photosystem II stability/assembly factor-like uncharacterized protein
MGTAAAVATRLLVVSLLLTACANPFGGPRFVPAGLDGRVVLSLLVGPSGTLYAGADDGVHRSEDAGRTWQVTTGLPDGTAVPGLSRGPGGLYAATSHGIFRSVDGHAWQPLGAGLPTDAPVLTVAPDAADAQRLVAGTGRHGIYRTLDGGATWQPASTGLPRELPIYIITADPTHPARLLAGTIGAGLFRSDDGGATWQPAGTGISPGANVFSIAGGDGWLALGTSVGFFQSTDGGQTWRWSREALGQTRVIALASDPATPRRLVAGADDGAYISADAGRTWRRLADGLPAGEHVGAVAIVGQRIVAGAGPAWALDLN